MLIEDGTQPHAELPSPILPPVLTPVPAPPGWLTALAQVILCSGLPTQFVIQLVFFSILLALGKVSSATDMNTPATLAAIELLDTALVLSLIWFFLKAGGERPRDIFIGARPIQHEVTLGMALIPVVFLIVVVGVTSVMHFAPSLHNVKESPLTMFFDTPFHSVLFAVVVIVAGGVREEVQRGFILHRFEQRLGGLGVGVVVSSIAFGAGHFLQGADVALTMMFVGAFWAILYVRRRSVIAAMTSHAGFDSAQVLQQILIRVVTRH